MAINRKDNKPKEIIKEVIKEVDKKIDNSKVLDGYFKSIDAAASGFAEYCAREREIKVLNGPGFDYGVRVFAYELVKNNLISCEDLFRFLKNNCYRGYNPEIIAWWNEKSR